MDRIEEARRYYEDLARFPKALNIRAEPLLPHMAYLLERVQGLEESYQASIARHNAATQRSAELAARVEELEKERNALRREFLNNSHTWSRKIRDLEKENKKLRNDMLTARSSGASK